jgi:hypothetical protein
MRNLAAGAFPALSTFNFRLWSAGALVSNIGTSMQRFAQHWPVLPHPHPLSKSRGPEMMPQVEPDIRWPAEQSGFLPSTEAGTVTDPIRPELSSTMRMRAVSKLVFHSMG